MRKLTLAIAAFVLALSPSLSFAKTAPALAPAAAAAPSATAAATVAPADPENLRPVAGVGQPTDGAYGLQTQVTDNGRFAAWMHDSLLMPLITVISLFVLGLLLYVVARYRRSANPMPSKTSHNTIIEVIWTGVPVLILAVVFIPSFTLLRAQYAKVGTNAITLKATGNQWFWSYKYPDNGDFEIVANMLPEDVAKARGEPRLLAVDNRILVPVNTPIKVITTSNDVIHSWAVPAFWTKMDAVPGRLNETSFKADKIGLYYGQCSELCGARHGFMPIAVEVVTMKRFNEWILAHGGKVKGAPAGTSPTLVAAVTAPTAAKN